MRVTHPFHPWHGREFVLLGVRQTWSEDRVFFVDGDRLIEANVWDSLGYNHHRLGDLPRAVASYRQAVVLFRQVDGRHYLAHALASLGDVYHSEDDPDAARDAWRQALELLTAVGRPGDEELRTRLAGLLSDGQSAQNSPPLPGSSR